MCIPRRIERDNPPSIRLSYSVSAVDFLLMTPTGHLEVLANLAKHHTDLSNLINYWIHTWCATEHDRRYRVAPPIIPVFRSSLNKDIPGIAISWSLVQEDDHISDIPVRCVILMLISSRNSFILFGILAAFICSRLCFWFETRELPRSVCLNKPYVNR